MRYICTAVVATLALVGTSFAAIINVPGDYATIQGAINASSNGDVIAIAAGTYYEHSLNPNGKAITIGSASGNLDVTIDANGGGSVFVINSYEGSGTVIQDVVITGGSADSGGGIYCDNSNPTITNCTIEDNTASNRGGGISCWSQSSPTITNCTIEDNMGYYGGGISCYDNYSNPTISNCTIEDNTGYYGGGISCDYYSTPTISNCTIEGNTAYYSAGGIYCYDSSPTLIDTNVCGNELDQIYGSWTDGGGNTVADECPATLHVPSEYATIQGAINASSHGDVIAIAAGTYYEHTINPNGKAITIGSASGNLDVTIDAQQGGRVFMIESGETSGTIIKDLVITGGSSSYGGGIRCDVTSPTISNCTITGNMASQGGGIFCQNSISTISGCTISGNTAVYGGGGIYSSSSTPTISGCTISGNTVSSTNNLNRGGGINCNYSNLTISGCTISGNTATNGGGIYGYNSNPIISESSICGNALNQIDTPHTASETCIQESCDPCFADSDADGVPDYRDQCPGEDDMIDTDSDGTPDCIDGCPDDPLKTEPGDCGCGGVDTNVYGDINCDGVYDIDDIYAGMEDFNGPTGACCVSSGCVANSNDDCTALGGTWLGEGGSCDDCPASCMGDTDGNGVVNIEDLLNMLGSWGACP